MSEIWTPLSPTHLSHSPSSEWAQADVLKPAYQFKLRAQEAYFNNNGLYQFAADRFKIVSIIIYRFMSVVRWQGNAPAVFSVHSIWILCNVQFIRLADVAAAVTWIWMQMEFDIYFYLFFDGRAKSKNHHHKSLREWKTFHRFVRAIFGSNINWFSAFSVDELRI